MKPRLAAALVFLLFLLAPSVALAQVSATTIEVGKTYKLAADHDGADTTGYALYVDDVKVADLGITALSGGTITTAALPTLTAGPHALALAAVNGTKEKKSEPLLVTVDAPTPKPPTNLRLVIELAVDADGNVTFKAIDPAKVKQ